MLTPILVIITKREAKQETNTKWEGKLEKNNFSYKW